ncbi:GNAT family N-acetyltransferase [Teredinibacter franksiae]|uniref:GNAT family N-acetyltransferase n=1 Tax=Teredinibacter franksiae TaxID=2761453 RepID=UPI0016299792|nr:GNAT family protein [Teredinibacter franksiae]
MNKTHPRKHHPLHWQRNSLQQPVGNDLNWSSAKAPDGEPIKGSFANLEPISSQQHGLALYNQWKLDSQGAIWTYMPYGPFVTAEHYCMWLREQESIEAPCFYCITDAQGEPRGIFALDAIKPDKGSLELAHVMFSPVIQHTPTATEAVYLILNYAFEMGYRRCEWKCNALNEKSKKAAQRFGFSYEGLFRHHMVVKNRNRDTAWFAMTAEDWQQLQPAYRQWLDPSNFTHDGKQKCALSTTTQCVLRELIVDPLGTNNVEPDL